MLFKLAMRNMRRSVRDYAIYFVTLLVAVMVFYAFNSISDQQVLIQIEESGRMNVIELMNMMMGIFSVAIALVLGFLVIYSNQLLIRRRYREFGMYELLGMTAGQISRIILYETVLVGIVSLVLGLGLGVLASQLLSFGTAALFGVSMPDYRFEFSLSAFAMTLVCFAAIYVVVSLFNVVSIRRHKLVKLLAPQTSNQKVPVRNPWACFALFLVSIAILAAAYYELHVNGLVYLFDEHFVAATVLMLVGTLLFFFSLAGFLVAVITRARGFYLRGLRPFTMRQIASKVNTSFASMWVVCVLLFFAITTFSTGMGLADMFSSDIEEANPFDASIVSTASSPEYRKSDDPDPRATEAVLQQLDGWSEGVDASGRLDIYAVGSVTYGALVDATGQQVDDAVTNFCEYPINMVGLRQLNDCLELQGKPPVYVEPGEYLLTNNMSAVQALADSVVEQDVPLVLESADGSGEHVLEPQGKVLGVQLYDFSMPSNSMTFVVSDEVLRSVVGDEVPMQSVVNARYAPDSNAEELLWGLVDASDGVYPLVPNVISNVLSREEMVGQANGLRGLITYLALYIGLVFLIATAAVLAIQMVALTIDSLGRYKTLSQIGCDRRMLSGALFAQVLIYFLLPLGLAACHSGCAVSILSENLVSALGKDILPSVLMAAALVVAIYGIYMLVTFFTSRGVIRAEEVAC